MSRAVCWVHEDGDEATHDQLVQCFGAHKRLILEKTTSIYSGTDMKIGIDTPGLVACKELLHDMVDIDSKGRSSGSQPW